MAEKTVKMRYRGRNGDTNPDIGPYNGDSNVLEDNKVYAVGEELAKRLLVSYGWKPSGEEAKEWAEKQAEQRAEAADVAEDGEAPSQDGQQEAQDLGDAQHEDDDPNAVEDEAAQGSGAGGGESGGDSRAGNNEERGS